MFGPSAGQRWEMREWLRRHADSSAGSGSQRPAGRVNLPSARFICMQRVSRGFHAVTKAPVRPAYLPGSKTREGVYPCRKIKKKKKKARRGSVALDLGPPPVLCSQCAIRENSHRRFLVPLFSRELCRSGELVEPGNHTNAAFRMGF